MRSSRPLLAAIGTIALPAALLIGIATPTASATPGSSEYANWTLTGDQGTVRVPNVGAEGTFVTGGANTTISSGSSAWLSTSTPFGVVFGSSQGKPYLSTGIAAGSSMATVTYTFTDPGRVGSWAFALGDVDAETVTVSAIDTNGRAININYMFEGAFNYCAGPGAVPSTCAGSPGTDVPTWDPATATLVGSGLDTAGAAAWFRPKVPVRTLKLEMTGLSGLPRYQTWFAADDDESPPEYFVTVAARKCPAYTDIMANKARNNIMQSLQDLGVDSIYSGSTPVQPSVETDPATGQSACVPMEGWTFGFGTGFGPPNTGPYGSLTPVTGLNGTATTQSVTPLLDKLGNPTGQTLNGAATIALDAAQTTIIESARQLTAQGGIPGTPLNGQTDVAFGVLRCATDNYNGDNVEYVSFPAGTKHVFCYAYYVDETPLPGKITVTKEVTGPSDGVSFDFSGNVSYRPGGAFSLSNGRSISFERQSGQTWTIIEEENAPYSLTDITCTGGADVAIDKSARRADITLGPGEDVRCIFDNALVPQSSLEIYKVSDNGLGTFGGDVTGPGGYARSWSATTTALSQPAKGFDDNGLFAGTYRVSETPVTDWATGVACGYRDDSTIITAADHVIDVPIADGQAAVCLFVNRLNIDGGITVRSTIIGGSGAVTANSQYHVRPASGISAGDVLVLSNTAWNSAESGSAPGPLALGGYQIQGTPPASTSTHTWSVDSVSCTSGGVVSGTDVTVTLDAVNPDVTCDYVYRAEPINPTLTVTKSVTAGNSLRTGPVLIDVLCTTGSGPWSAQVALPVGSSTITKAVTLPRDATSCRAVESSTGEPTAIDPGVISVTADGGPWPEGQPQSVPNGTTLATAEASSSGVPVTRSTSGPCVDTPAGVTPTVANGTCTLTFIATGGAVTVGSTWTTSSGSGSGTQTPTFTVTPGGNYTVSFENTYSGTETQTTTTRLIEAEGNPATLVVSKFVPSGNELRNGPVTVEIDCAASAAADPSAWPKTLTVNTSTDNATRVITVPGNAQNADLCAITETSTGISNTGAGSIAPLWNGKRWKSTSTKSLLVTDSAKVTATASTGSPVSSTTSTPCVLSGTRLTADRAGQCTLAFTATGTPKVTVETEYPLGTSVVTTAGQTSQLEVVNRYDATSRTITAQRSVTVTDTPPCPLDVDAAKSVSANGTTAVIKGATTSDSCEITKVVVTCTTARAVPRGDYGCTVRRESGGRVYVTTYGDRSLVVNATVVAKGPGHTTTRWSRSWTVT